MATSDPFPTFSKFLESVSETKHEAQASRPAARALESSEFDAMKAHIMHLYDGVEVQHSFVDPTGQVFDCVPIEQQPSLKGKRPAKAPAVPDGPPSEAHGGQAGDLAVSSQLHPERKDRFGHSMTCPPGTIAIRRVTLDEMTKHERLDGFFRKTPWGGRHPLHGADDGSAHKFGITPGVHKYAHAYQTVNNVGGQAALNVWGPAVGSQVFSLAQHWYAGGSPVQTVEIGWQVYPAKYHTTLPVLFIYWTADGYNQTGAYNHDKAGFVQTNNAWTLGGSLSPVSVYGGAQYQLDIRAYLTGGNWWLYVGGGAASNAIGYYPASLYGNGPLRTHAVNVDYGGEVVDTTSWPPMGSGHFASEGWQRAAYVRDIAYYAQAGGAVQASLTPSQNSANCYTIQLGSAAAPWNKYFFYGGPGGSNCT